MRCIPEVSEADINQRLIYSSSSSVHSNSQMYSPFPPSFNILNQEFHNHFNCTPSMHSQRQSQQQHFGRQNNKISTIFMELILDLLSRGYPEGSCYPITVPNILQQLQVTDRHDVTIMLHRRLKNMCNRAISMLKHATTQYQERLQTTGSRPWQALRYVWEHKLRNGCWQYLGASWQACDTLVESIYTQYMQLWQSQNQDAKRQHDADKRSDVSVSADTSPLPLPVSRHYLCFCSPESCLKSGVTSSST